jgi:ATP-dependent DNA helicase HFM1/MER3
MDAAAALAREAGAGAPAAGHFAGGTVTGSVFVRNGQQQQRLRLAATKTQAKALAAALVAGVGFHNAAMEPADRALVEELFKAGDLAVRVVMAAVLLQVLHAHMPKHSLTALATHAGAVHDEHAGNGRQPAGPPGCAEGHGALGGRPGGGARRAARLQGVLADRGEQRAVWSAACTCATQTPAALGHGWGCLCALQVLQMVGRAGRPQFDTEGVAVIMTSRDSTSRYQRLLAGQVVESCLMANLPEHLNAEIVLGTIQDVPQAVAWIKSTFLFTRVRANPQHYGCVCQGCCK